MDIKGFFKNTVAFFSEHISQVFPIQFVLTLMLPDCLGLFFIHLKLELLTPFPAPNDEK